MMRDQIFDQHEVTFAVRRAVEGYQTRQRRRDFYAGKVQLHALGSRLFEFDRERERKI